MKKFGIRALACSLAVMMVAGLGAPAVASAEEDILLISPAPAKAEKVLHITEDMVDEDGEIVISGGTYDRVFVSKEAAAKDIYFDQVTVGELVVEGGNKANVQLWEVEADKLTVQEPELEKLSLFDLLPLLKDPETQQAAIEMYQQSLAKDNYALNVAPTIVTKDDAKVDELVTRTNVKLDLGAGEVGEVALEASAKQNRVNVTLSNYEGNVSYKGGDEFSSVILKSEDSRIKNLKVEESNANNHFTVTGKNTVVMKAEVAGNANVALNAMMGAVKVTEEATAANVTLLNVAEELTVAGKGANIQLSGNANVTFATVTSDDVKISGVGTLGEADLQGKGAYVSTFGTKVEGENTYIPYTIPLHDSWSEDFSDAELAAGVPTDGGSMNWASYKYDAENGYGVVSTTAGWQGFAVELDNRDNGSSANFVISLRAKKLGGAETAVRISENPAWPNLGKQVTLSEDSWSTVTSDKITVAAGATRVILIAPATGSAGVVLEMAVDDVNVQRYTEWTEPPARPKPTENVTYNFSEMTAGTSYDVTKSVTDGVLRLSFAKQYGEAQYNLPQGMFTDDFDRIVVHMSDCTGTVDFKIIAGGKNIKDNYSKDGTCILDLSDVPGYEVTTIGIMQDSTGSCNAVIEGFTFVVAGTEYELPAEPPKAPGELQEDALVYAATDFESESLIGGYGYTKEAAEHDGLKVTLSDAGYQEIQFNLPEAIVAGTYEKMVVTVSSTTNAFAVKAGGKAWYNNSATKTTDLVFDLAEVTSDITQVGLMAGASTGTEFVVYRIAFLPKEEETGAKTTYTFKELTETGKWGNYSAVDATTGKATLTFTGQYNQAFYAIPEGIDMTKVESITLNGLTGSSYAIKAQTAAEYEAGGDAVILGYDNATLQTGGADVKYFVIMSTDANAATDAPQVITIDSVTFNVVEEEATNTYTFSQISETGKWGNYSAVDATTGKTTLTFTGQYNQAFYAIPEGVDMTTVGSITLNGLTGSSYAIKAQTAAEYEAGGDAVILGYDNATLQTGGADVKYFVIMSTDANATTDAPQVITIDSVTFNPAE